jgi:hypothetical protein
MNVEKREELCVVKCDFEEKSNFQEKGKPN